MKKFLIIVIIIGVVLYLLAKLGESAEGGDAVYNEETYDIEDTIDPNDEEAFMQYGAESFQE